MRLLKTALSVMMLLLSVSAFANTLPRTISILNKGVPVTTFKVPLSTKIEVSADQQDTNEKNTKTNFKGKVTLSLTFPSGETMNINAEEVEIAFNAHALKNEKMTPLENT